MVQPRREPVEVGRFRISLSQPLQGFGQPLGLDGLHQVIGRGQFKGLKRVLTKGCHENNRGTFSAQGFGHAQAVEARHLDIQEQHVGFQPFNGLQGLQAVLSLPQYLHAPGLGQ